LISRRCRLSRLRRWNRGDTCNQKYQSRSSI